MDLTGIGTVERAQDGDLEPLLDRLCATNLAPDEIDWIERRLRGDPSAKMRAGPKAKDTRDRDWTIVYLDEWLRIRYGEKSAANRHKHLSKVKIWNLSGGAIRKIIENVNRPNLMLRIQTEQWRTMRFLYGLPDKNSAEIPELLRDALNPPD